MPITKENQAIAVPVRATIVALAAPVLSGVVRPRRGVMATVAGPAPAAPEGTVRLGIARVARVPVAPVETVRVATGARVRRIAVPVMMRARPVRRRALRPRS